MSFAAPESSSIQPMGEGVSSEAVSFDSSSSEASSVSDIPKEPVIEDKTISLDDFTLVKTAFKKNFPVCNIIPGISKGQYLYFKCKIGDPLKQTGYEPYSIIYRVDTATSETAVIAFSPFTWESDNIGRETMVFGDKAFEAAVNHKSIISPALNMIQSDIISYNYASTEGRISISNYFTNFNHITADKLDETYFVSLANSKYYDKETQVTDQRYYLTLHSIFGGEKELTIFRQKEHTTLMDMRADNGIIYILSPSASKDTYELARYDKDMSSKGVIPLDGLVIPGKTRGFEIRNDCLVLDNEMAYAVYVLTEGVPKELTPPVNNENIRFIGYYEDYLMFEKARTQDRCVYALDTNSKTWTAITVTGGSNYQPGVFYVTADGGLIVLAYSRGDGQEYYMHMSNVFPKK